MATQTTTRSRPRLTSVAPSRSSGDEACRIEIVENPIRNHDPELAASIEERLHELLRDENLGAVNVRFRVCRDEDDSFRFICKVENPPRVDTDVAMPWRWWSPIMASADDLAAALEDSLRVRRARLSATAPLSR